MIRPLNYICRRQRGKRFSAEIAEIPADKW